MSFLEELSFAEVTQGTTNQVRVSKDAVTDTSCRSWLQHCVTRRVDCAFHLVEFLFLRRLQFAPGPSMSSHRSDQAIAPGLLAFARQSWDSSLSSWVRSVNLQGYSEGEAASLAQIGDALLELESKEILCSRLLSLVAAQELDKPELLEQVRTTPACPTWLFRELSRRVNRLTRIQTTSRP